MVRWRRVGEASQEQKRKQGLDRQPFSQMPILRLFFSLSFPPRFSSFPFDLIPIRKPKPAYLPMYMPSLNTPARYLSPSDLKAKEKKQGYIDRPRHRKPRMRGPNYPSRPSTRLPTPTFIGKACETRSLGGACMLVRSVKFHMCVQDARRAMGTPLGCRPIIAMQCISSVAFLSWTTNLHFI